jgi:transcriptional regulator with PAS, ATPase and Fis domain
MDLLDLDNTLIIGKSAAVRDKREFIAKAARCASHVLILGETGTGKDLMARNIHALSPRRKGAYIAINCSDIPEDLFEAELFGYARGSFTGAFKEKPGLLEVAPGGTAFLDEIGNLSLVLQAKLLRVIEGKEIRRIGETAFRAIDVRFIFATNEDLLGRVRRGTFRQDLYYRITVLKFVVPPLRERKEDIPLLAEHFLDRQNQIGNTKKTYSPSALSKLISHDFPGNIRELENVIERAFAFSESDQIQETDLQIEEGAASGKEDFEDTPDQLRQVLENCRWNKTRAASEIGKSRRQFYRILEKYQMSDCIRKN